MKTTEKILALNSVFGNEYIVLKNLYLLLYETIPCNTYFNSFNGEKAYKAFAEKNAAIITDTYTYKIQNYSRKKEYFENTIVVLQTKCVLEFKESSCDVYYDISEVSFVEDLKLFFAGYKHRTKREPFEMNILVKNGNYLEFKAMDIKKTKLDLDLFYNDDFAPIDALITKRLNQKNDKGIVLLHGLPGAGKTTYLRYLIGKLKKKIIFLSPNMADSLVNPEFMEMLIDNPNSVVIIEDAENIITDRKISNSSSVSNLLNISDGLLSDFLNVQLVCTFNNALTLVDSALMRKGRLIAKYQFDKLSIDKAQRLSKHFGQNEIINKPMTIAEIANPLAEDVAQDRTAVIGFRQRVAVMN